MYNSAEHMYMLQAVTDTLPSAVLSINNLEDITSLYISRRYSRNSCRLCGKSFVRILSLVFGPEEANVIYAVYQESLDAQLVRELVRICHLTLDGRREYFYWRFCPRPDQKGMTVFIRNITESILIEDEFSAVTEQYESVNRELSSAMSNLDFHLMDLEQAHKKLAALYRITSIVQETVDLQEVLEEILNGIVGELDFNHAAILLFNEDSQELTMGASRGYRENIHVPLGIGITGHAALYRQLIYVPDVSEDPRYIRGTADAVSEVAVPLIADNRILGVLDLETSVNRPLQPFDFDLLRSLASQIAITLVHAKHVAAMQMQAITDGLTGLYNYRYFQGVLKQEFKRAARYHHPLSMLMLDIDNFKQFNDEYGHRMGDEVLRVVSSILRQSCRDVDYVVRYGGEEFAVLLPETEQDDAYAIAERIRSSVAKYLFRDKNGCQRPLLTISIGLSSYPANANTEIELMDQADHALYAAKRSSRNRVCRFSKISKPPASMENEE